tara:strand:- start:4375 stop:4974 length:600 start_codon:yes stop_codon:yes gene_type:complete
MSFVGDIIGGFVQDRAAKRADNTMREASAAEIAESRRQYDQTRTDFEPWRTTGAEALKQLAGDINKPITAAEVMQDPGYQFGMQQGEQALSRRLAAGGGRVSGAALKAASRFGTDYGASGYGAAYQRGQDRLNRLAALGQVGQTATGQTAQAGQFATGNIGRSLSNQGEATAASQLRRGNIWENTTNKLISSASGFFGG